MSDLHVRSDTQVSKAELPKLFIDAPLASLSDRSAMDGRRLRASRNFGGVENAQIIYGMSGEYSPTLGMSEDSIENVEFDLGKVTDVYVPKTDIAATKR